MNRTVESITETSEQVMNAIGLKAEKSNDDQQSESSSEENLESDENTSNDSETLENEEQETDGESDDLKEKSEDKSKPRKKGGFAKKIGKLTAEKNSIAAERDALKAQIEALKQKPIENVENKNTSQGPKEPDEKDFETYSDYMKAVVKYEAQLLIASEKEQEKIKNQKQIEQQTEAQRNKTFGERFNKFMETVQNPDEFQELLDNAWVPNHVIEVIKDRELGPELMHELATNHQERERINSLPPKEALFELAKLEAKVSVKDSSANKQINKISKAPKPISPVSTSTGAGAEKDPYQHEMSYQEFKAWSAKQKK